MEETQRLKQHNDLTTGVIMFGSKNNVLAACTALLGWHLVGRVLNIPVRLMPKLQRSVSIEIRFDGEKKVY